MTNKMKSSVELITQKDALTLLQNNSKNRTLDRKRVEYYSEQMVKGYWRLSPEGIAIASTGVLIDGQHRLAAIARTGIAQEMVVTRNCDESVINVINKGKSRTTADDLAIMGIRNPIEISSGIRGYLRFKNSGEYIVKRGTSLFKSAASTDDILAFYETDPEFYNQAAADSAILNSVNKLRLFSKTEYFTWLVYLTKDKGYDYTKVFNFFYDDLNNHSEIAVVNTLRNRILVDKGSRGAQQMTKEEKQRYLIYCWNAFVLGKKPRILKVNNENICFI